MDMLPYREVHYVYCAVMLPYKEVHYVYCAIIVSDAVAVDTPGLVGTPSVVAPEPACTKNESA